MAQYLRGPENLAHAQFFHAMNGPHSRVGPVFDKHTVEGRNPGLLLCSWHSLRMALWDEIRDVASRTCNSWLVAGVFNGIISADERRGGAPFNPTQHRNFNEILHDCCLVDIGRTGPRFTWRGSQVGPCARLFQQLRSRRGQIHVVFYLPKCCRSCAP